MPSRTRPLSPAYAARIARARARGKTLQEARGHKPGEYRERAARERAEHNLTGDEERRIRRWVERRSGDVHDSDFDADEVIEYFRERDYDSFRQFRDVWNAERRNWKNNPEDYPLVKDRKGRYRRSKGWAHLEALTAAAGVEDLTWLYYH